MKIIKFLSVFFLISLPFISCKNSNCDYCQQQKREYCFALMESNCNGAFLTTNIDNLIRACGQDEANNYISTATQQCTQGTLECPSDECN